VRLRRISSGLKTRVSLCKAVSPPQADVPERHPSTQSSVISCDLISSISLESWQLRQQIRQFGQKVAGFQNLGVYFRLD
jgi:hypothetical protein